MELILKALGACIIYYICFIVWAFLCIPIRRRRFKKHANREIVDLILERAFMGAWGLFSLFALTSFTNTVLALAIFFPLIIHISFHFKLQGVREARFEEAQRKDKKSES